MPELPEVETITNRLRPYVVGKKIASIQTFHDKSFTGDSVSLVGKSITDVTRRAKMIRIHLNTGNLLVHLKMTGQLIYKDNTSRVGGGHPTLDWVQSLPSSHTRIEISFADKSQLFFNDQRVFGWIRHLNDAQIAQEFKKYALDVTDEGFTLPYFAKKVSKSNRAIKMVIMDNALMAGVGNIYACDALNLAQISPYTKATELQYGQVKQLYDAIKTVIYKGIALGGATTDGKFIDVDGFAGKYQLEALAYDRAGQACKNCGHTIIKEKLGGRGTYYCPECQQ